MSKNIIRALAAAAALATGSMAAHAQQNIFKVGVIEYTTNSKTNGIHGAGVPPGADAETGNAATLLSPRHVRVGDEVALSSLRQALSAISVAERTAAWSRPSEIRPSHAENDSSAWRGDLRTRSASSGSVYVLANAASNSLTRSINSFGGI